MADQIPVGAIIPFAGPANNIPQGWMECDGSLLDKSTYQSLFNAIGTSWGGDGANKFAIPDLRGQFLRGVSGVSKVDPDADKREVSRPDLNSSGNGKNAVGSKQPDDLRSHLHGVHGSVLDCGQGQGYQVLNNTTVPTYTQNTLATGGQETRPVNTYVYFIIKF